MKPMGRRFLQFSLSTFLIAVAVISIWLGKVVNQARDQQRAVETVLSREGRRFVFYEDQLGLERDLNPYPWVGAGGIVTNDIDPKAEAAGPAWLRDMVGEHYFRRLVHVRVEDVAIVMNDSELEAICQVPSITWLSIMRADITDSGMRHLTNLKRVRKLSLGTCGAPITDEGLSHLRDLPDLEWLELWTTSITDEGLKHLIGLSKLKFLQLGNGDPRKPKVRTNAKLTVAGLLQLKACKSLRLIGLRGTTLSAEERAEVRSKLPNVVLDFDQD
jgi:hypothetical protein